MNCQNSVWSQVKRKYLYLKIQFKQTNIIQTVKIIHSTFMQSIHLYNPKHSSVIWRPYSFTLSTFDPFSDLSNLLTHITIHHHNSIATLKSSWHLRRTWVDDQLWRRTDVECRENNIQPNSSHSIRSYTSACPNTYIHRIFRSNLLTHKRKHSLLSMAPFIPKHILAHSRQGSTPSSLENWERHWNNEGGEIGRKERFEGKRSAGIRETRRSIWTAKEDGEDIKALIDKPRGHFF
jgi:hypothetical protein